MTILGLDIGSSSVKAAIVRNRRNSGKIARREFITSYVNDRAEVESKNLLRAISGAISQLGSMPRNVDAIALSVMGPAWVAMDKHGRPLTAIVTHQDRRGVEEAKEIERRVGKRRHLRLAGNRPFPGGISSTTWLWFQKHRPHVLRRCDLIGHLNTFLHMQMTGSRVIDPSNASFTGLYATLTQSGWSDELCDAVGVSEHQLPQLMDADAVGGLVTRSAGRRFGLTHGTPVLVGLMDGSAAALATGAPLGQLTNSVGSTDVLALCTDRPEPDEQLLTRALGVGRKWLSVATLAAAGSTLQWAHEQLFADLPDPQFWKLVQQLARKARTTTVRFEPYLAGERTSVEQRRAAFFGLTLATTRKDLLSSIIETLAESSVCRLEKLQAQGMKIRRDVLVAGRAQSILHEIFHRDWSGRWRFRYVEEAALVGLGRLVPK